LAAVAGISPVGLKAKANETADLRHRGIVAFPEDIGGPSPSSQPVLTRGQEHGKTSSNGLVAFISRRPSSGAGNGTAKTNHEIVSALRRIWPGLKWLSELAWQSLIAEAELTPKPGLVDGRGLRLTFGSVRST